MKLGKTCNMFCVRDELERLRLVLMLRNAFGVQSVGQCTGGNEGDLETTLPMDNLSQPVQACRKRAKDKVTYVPMLTRHL